MVNPYWNDEETVKWFSSQVESPYWLDFLKKMSPISKYDRALDVGCGGGRNTVMLSKFFHNVYAVDHSDAMVNATKEVTAQIKSNVQVTTAFQSELPFDDKYFNLVISHGVLHNEGTIPGFIKSITELSRVLSDRGVLLVNCFVNHKDVCHNMKQKSGEFSFTTPDGLSMTLLPPDALIGELLQSGFSSFSDLALYESKMKVGVRWVLRGIFWKQYLSSPILRQN